MDRWGGRINLPEFEIKEISLNETKQIIKGLGNSKSFGRDELERFLSEGLGEIILAPLIQDIIKHICQKK